MARDFSYVRRWAAATYFVLTFAISWSGALVLLGPRAFPLRWERFETFGPAFFTVILVGPFLASLLSTSLIDGRAGLCAVLSRLRRWRVGAGWYACALVPALLLAVAHLILSLFFPPFVPAVADSNDKAGIILLSLGVSLLFGVFEEIGWTGFAVPRLRAHHTVLISGLVVGLAWGGWHFLLFWQSDSFSGVLPFGLLLIRLFSWLPAFRVLMAWVFDRTGSLPVVMLMHAGIVFAQLLLRPQQLRGAPLMASVLVMPATMWLLMALLLVMWTRKRFVGLVGSVYREGVAAS